MQSTSLWKHLNILDQLQNIGVRQDQAFYWSYRCHQLAVRRMEDATLPEHFADKLLELEASLEFEATMETIKELNDLYRAGIDYYIQNEPKKAMHLQRKMTSLLANPDNIRILEREINRQPSTKYPLREQPHHSNPNSQAQQPQPNSQRPTAANHSKLNTRKIKEQVNKFHFVADTCIQSMMENSNKVAVKVQQLKEQQTNKQQEQLKDRIMLKRVKSQEKLFRMNSLNEGAPHAAKQKKGQGTPTTEAGSPNLRKLIE